MGSVALVDADKMEPVSGLDRPRLFAKWQGSQLDWKAIAKGIAPGIVKGIAKGIAKGTSKGIASNIAKAKT